MTGWWRRNAVALSVLPVIVAGFWGVSAIDASRNAPIGALEPIVLDHPDGPVAYAGYDLTSFRGASFRTDEFPQYETPKGMHYVAVGFSGRAIDQDEVSNCYPITITETTGAERTFAGLPPDFGWDGGEFTTDCSSGLDPTFQAFVPFLVPDDSHGPYVVTLRDLSGPDLQVTIEAAMIKDSED